MIDDSSQRISHFRAPSLIVTGPGSAEQTPNTLDRIGVERVVIVTDRNLMAVVSPVVDSLDGMVAAIYEDVITEPTITHVEEILAILKETEADGLVTIGGGSAIDAGKAAAAMATHPGSISSYQGYDRFQSPPLPLVAIPTTGGTGSEATRVVVITDKERQVKMMLMADQLMATAAVVDPLLMVSCPPTVTASSGVDALTHAIEAYVSRRSQPMTDVLALAACSSLATRLRHAHRNGNDIEARAKIAIGALQAGMAFSNSSVALIHGMSRPLGAVFGIPHGIANAMLLPTVMRFSLEGALGRYGDLGEAMGVADPDDADISRATAAIEEIEKLTRDLGIPSLGAYGLDRDEFEAVLEKMAQDALDSGSPANNPIVPTGEQIVDLYRACY
jgi:alcohol dehydrogenase class IV